MEKNIPELNVGIVGHVDHGKTTLTSVLTGKFTDVHSEEIKRGITIRLGYADTTIYECPKCSEDNLKYSRFPKCFHCGSATKKLRSLSVVDAPGHESLMATVLSGASIMDGALLLVAANEKCPQPQTEEHLEALRIAGIKNIIIVQNKVDIVKPEEAKKNYDQIKKFVKGSFAENAPIIPVSAQHSINVGYLFKAIYDNIPVPKRDEKANPEFLVARSFDINKPGTAIDKLKGGVLGGSIIAGVLNVGDEIEIMPGIARKDKWKSIITKITKIFHGGVSVKCGKAGGLLAVETQLDPFLSKSDSLAGSVVGLSGKLSKNCSEMKVKVEFLKRIVGTEELKGNQTNLMRNDIILIHLGTQRTIGICVKPGNVAEFKLPKRPLCVNSGEKVAFSKQINKRWRLIGYGTVQ
ncbi:MAG: translation initiation factor IF-2 subunit gamma [Candidatus Aenigmarchaeota archaeon]|nr:translation initiation factor IF-2 subunit gamma [Candidatus Aenigmarchaeota archaeon]